MIRQLKQWLRSVPILGQLLTRVWHRIQRGQRAWQQRKIQQRQQEFVYSMAADYPGSQVYWEKRYQEGMSSGPGSFGEIARYKAQTVNDFVREHRIQSVIDFGCGDGNQLVLADYPAYIGLDISPTAIAKCQKKFAGDMTKRFEVYSPPKAPAFQAEVALSMEVIFHLTEDSIYETYMRHLFASATRFVVIFASDTDDSPDLSDAYHVKHRPIKRWIAEHQPHWQLKEAISHPYTNRASESYSISKFYIYERGQAG